MKDSEKRSFDKENEREKKKEKSMEKGSLKKQFVSGGIYIALAAAIVTVTMGSVSRIMNGDMGYVAPKTDIDSDIENGDIVLPNLLDSYGGEEKEVSGTGKGVAAKIEIKEKASEKDEAPAKSDTLDGEGEDRAENSAEKAPSGKAAANAPVDDNLGGNGSGNGADGEGGKEKESGDRPEAGSAASAEAIGEAEFPTDPADPLFDGKLHKVADGYICREFSIDELLYSPTMKDFRTHDGIDVTGDPGSAVRAFADGKVTEVYFDPHMGQTVMIDHGNGICAKYMNLSEALPQNITVGAELSGGDTLGGIGNTAATECADVSHVHLTVTRDGVLIDPEKYLGSEK